MFTLLRFKVHGSLYIIHGAFKTGAESSRLNIKANKDLVTESQIDTFKQECLLFLVATTKKLFDKLKLGSSILRYARCLNPSHLINLASSSESFKLLINRLVYLKILPAKTVDKTLSQFSGFILNCVKEEPEKITFFNPKKQRIDDLFFYFTIYIFHQ